MKNPEDQNFIFPLVLFLVIMFIVLLFSRGITSLDGKTEKKVYQLRTDMQNVKMLIQNHEPRLDLLEQK